MRKFVPIACGVFLAVAVAFGSTQQTFARNLQKHDAQKKADGKNCWMLTQVNPYSTYSHSQIIFVAAEGISMATDDVKFFLLAPTYEVGVYNTGRRQFYRAPLDVWLSKYKALPFAQTKKYLEKVGTGTLAGMPVQRYLMKQGHGADARKLREIWVTDAIDAPLKSKQILQHICGIPEGEVEGVPLRVVRLLDNGKQDLVLNTLTVKRIATPKAAFLPPHGFLKVKSELSLMLNYGSDSELKNLLEGTTDSRK